MLHFLAIVALCIFIGERLVRYWSAYRLRRAVQRSLAPPKQPLPRGHEPGAFWFAAGPIACIILLIVALFAP